MDKCKWALDRGFIDGPCFMEFHGKDGSVVTINLSDGSVSFGPTMTTDEAARAFWRAVEELFPGRILPAGLVSVPDIGKGE